MDARTSADLYRESRERVTTAVQGLGPDELDRQVPACPQWSVQDLVAHLTGVAADFVNGNLAGAPMPPWTAVRFRGLFGRRSAAQVLQWDWDTPANAVAWSVGLARLPQTPVPLDD
jgi:hypothetical protein